MAIFDSLISWAKTAAIWIMYIVIIGALIYVISLYYIRRKNNKRLEDIQQEILREGRVNVNEMKLRFLFTSRKGVNPLNEGKIVAYVMGQNDGVLYSIFAVRKTQFAQVDFYKVKTGLHSDLFRDVTLDGWNFTPDERNLFLINNETHVTLDYHYSKERASVDTIGNLAPLVHKAILANYIHRIRLRERRLLKLSEDEQRTSP